MIDDWLPLTGSTSELNEKPISVSTSEPAAETAANSVASRNETAAPPGTSWRIGAPEPTPSTGISPPVLSAIGNSATASATATMPRARAGTILLENSGASKNSGD